MFLFIGLVSIFVLKNLNGLLFIILHKVERSVHLDVSDIRVDRFIPKDIGKWKSGQWTRPETTMNVSNLPVIRLEIHPLLRIPDTFS